MNESNVDAMNSSFQLSKCKRRRDGLWNSMSRCRNSSKEIRKNTKKPLIVKLSPNAYELTRIAKIS